MSNEHECYTNQVSYLYGRDPSILAYNQRPFPSHETKKNLYSLLESDECDETSSQQNTATMSTVSKNNVDPADERDTIKVYLRLKPFPPKIKLTDEQKDAYQIVNTGTLITKIPSLDNNSSCLKKSRPNETICRKFIFTRTFDAETTQMEIFDNIVRPQMLDFLHGKNCIVMSYGKKVTYIVYNN